MNVSLKTSKGISIEDRLMFFTGDKPAAQFERGTQISGHYPCGSCGAHIVQMDNFAFCANCKWRSLGDIQAIATRGN